MVTLDHTHHQQTIDRASSVLRQDPEVIAVFLGGSLAKGYARPESDVDLIMVVTESAFQRRRQSGERHFFSSELADYPGGYVEGKIIDLPGLRQIAADGNEPTRYAFHLASPLICDDAEVTELIRQAATFPMHKQSRHREQFYAMVLAWHCHEALRIDNQFLLNYAVSQLSLFAGRLVLNENARLHPYLKWLMAEVSECRDAPQNIVQLIDDCQAQPLAQPIDRLLNAIQIWGRDRLSVVIATQWPQVFMDEIENPWMVQTPHINDF